MSWIESSEAASRFGLDVDESFYNVTSKYGDLFIYSLSAACVKCPFSKLLTVKKQKSFKINSANDYAFRIFEYDEGPYSNSTQYLCELNRTSGEFGAYNLVVHASGRCEVETVFEPVNIYFRK